MSVYADSSFLVAVCTRNAHTSAALALWRRLEEVPLPFHPVHRLEVRNAIRHMVFTGDIAPPGARLALDYLDESMGEDFLHLPLNWSDVLRRAEDITASHTPATGLRSLDAFHLAAAVETRHTVFLTFDEVQGATATALGLEVFGV